MLGWYKVGARVPGDTWVPKVPMEIADARNRCEEAIELARDAPRTATRILGIVNFWKRRKGTKWVDYYREGNDC